MDLVPHQPVSMTISSEPAHLPIVRAAIEKMCRMLHFDAKDADGVVLSADEALTNIIKHAYRGNNDQKIEIELSPIGADNPTGLQIRLSDTGRRVDPEKIKSRDLDDVRPGGLGVHIMTECMDQVDFQQRDEGGTTLTMIKNIRQEHSNQK